MFLVAFMKLGTLENDLLETWDVLRVLANETVLLKSLFIGFLLETIKEKFK